MIKHRTNENHIYRDYISMNSTATKLQRDVFFKERLCNREFTFIGNIGDISSNYIYLKTDFDRNVTAYPSYDRGSITISFNFSENMNRNLLKYKLNDLVICTGRVLGQKAEGALKLELVSIENYNGVTDEQLYNEHIRRKRRSNLEYALLFGGGCILCIYIGGWMWIFAIILGFLSLGFLEIS